MQMFKRRNILLIYTASNVEQILTVSPNKTATVRPPTTHLENHPGLTNKICGILMEK